jgi:Protein of unknown function (DUF2924)
MALQSHQARLASYRESSNLSLTARRWSFMKENAEIKTEQVASEIASLRTLNARSLRNTWQELYGTKAPRCARPSLMVRAIAYKLQENAFGGLKSSVRRLLEKGAEDALARRPIKI